MADSFVVNVECAIYRDDEWLMIVRSDKEDHAPGTLSMAGGTAEHTDSEDNTFEEVARREVLEELGVEVGDKLHYVESKMFVTAIGKHVIDVVLMGEYRSGEPKAVSADEVASFGWMALTAIEQHPQTPPWILQSMRKAEAIRKSL